MKLQKLLISALPFVLAGCLDIFNEDEPVTNYPPYPPQAPAPQPVIPVPAPVHAHAVKPSHAGCDCPVEQASVMPIIPSSALPSSPATAEPDVKPDAAWQPTDGHLVRGGDLLMELQRKHGRRPSHSEMIGYLQEKMHLSAEQAGIIIEELGV